MVLHVKNGNASRRKSIVRDVTQVIDFMKATPLSPLPLAISTSVMTCSKTSIPSSSARVTATPATTARTSISASYAAETLSGDRWKLPPKAERAFESYNYPEDIQIHGWRTPAEWRDLSTPLTLLAFHRTLASHDSHMAFSLNMSHKIEALFRPQPAAANWMLRRITTRLKLVLNRNVSMWFAVEHADGPSRRLHLHGECAIEPHEIDAARKAMRQAGGEWPKTRQHQVKCSEMPDAGWPTYSAKDHPVHTSFMRNNFPGSRYTSVFKGKWYASTRCVKKAARVEYSQWRAAAIALRCSLH